jgi:hypothetical protein
VRKIKSSGSLDLNKIPSQTGMDAACRWNPRRSKKERKKNKK